RLAALDIVDAQHTAVLLVGRLDQLAGDRRLRVDQVIGQNHHERLIAHDGRRAQYSVTQPKRRGLARIDAVDVRGNDILHRVQQLGLVLGRQVGLELGGAVEMVFDGALVAPRDEDQVGDPGRDGLFDRVLYQRLVENGQHLFGHGLGGRQKARAHSRHGKYSFANRFHSLAVDGKET